MIKITALLVAVLLTLAIVPTMSLTVRAQENATSTTNTTTTETNTTIPVEDNTATQLPVFPEEGLVGDENLTLGNENVTTPSNQTEQGIVSKDNATKVIGLLDDAQIKIDEARELIRGLQAQIEAAKEQPGNATDEIIQDANDTATDIEEIAEGNITDSEVIGDLGNMTEDIVAAINDTIESNPMQPVTILKTLQTKQLKS